MVLVRFGSDQNDRGFRQLGFDLIEQRIPSGNVQRLTGSSQDPMEMIGDVLADPFLVQPEPRRYAAVRLAVHERGLDLGAIGVGGRSCRHTALGRYSDLG